MARKVMTQLNRTMRTNSPRKYRHVVRVRPLTDLAKQFVRHPSVGGFTGGDSGTLWPRDSFTTRRIRDGDIEVVTEQAAEPKSRRMTGHARATGGDV
jgi:hypothetical protein